MFQVLDVGSVICAVSLHENVFHDMVGFKIVARLMALANSGGRIWVG